MSSLGLCKRARRIHDVDSDDDAAVPHTGRGSRPKQSSTYRKKCCHFGLLHSLLCSAAAAAAVSIERKWLLDNAEKLFNLNAFSCVHYLCN